MSSGSFFASPLGYRPRPLFPSAVSLAMYDWFYVSACGPRFCAMRSLIDFLCSNTSLFICSKILFVSACASFISSSIPISNCCGIGTFDADLPAATLAPIVGGGGVPLLDDAG